GKGWRLAQVVDVSLVREAEEQNAAAVEWLLARIEGLGETVHDPLRHGCVDLAGQLDKARVLSVLAGFPSEVKRIDRDAMSTQARPWIKRHEPEWLGFRRVDDLPHIDAHGVVHHFEFVHERDVYRAKNIFQKLRRLGGAARRDGHER